MAFADLTPFLSDGLIDAEALRIFIAASYKDAGYTPGDIDSGAVILTGEAIKRRNARAIDEIFANEAGKFVCATASLARMHPCRAHGSGAVALSRERQSTILHVDVGGGTTKLALIDKGVIVGVMAFAVGGRLIAQDDKGQWTRVDDSAVLAAKDLRDRDRSSNAVEAGKPRGDRQAPRSGRSRFHHRCAARQSRPRAATDGITAADVEADGFHVFGWRRRISSPTKNMSSAISRCLWRVN